MARYRIENSVVDTDNATATYEEETYHDGHNYISQATGSQWDHETLYRSRRGRYYLVRSSQWQGSRNSAEWLSPQESARWLLSQDHDLPEDLAEYEDEISE